MQRNWIGMIRKCWNSYLLGSGLFVFVFILHRNQPRMVYTVCVFIVYPLVECYLRICGFFHVTTTTTMPMMPTIHYSFGTLCYIHIQFKYFALTVAHRIVYCVPYVFVNACDSLYTSCSFTCRSNVCLFFWIKLNVPISLSDPKYSILILRYFSLIFPSKKTTRTSWLRQIFMKAVNQQRQHPFFPMVHIENIIERQLTGEFQKWFIRSLLKVLKPIYQICSMFGILFVDAIYRRFINYCSFT